MASSRCVYNPKNKKARKKRGRRGHGANIPVCFRNVIGLEIRSLFNFRAYIEVGWVNWAAPVESFWQQFDGQNESM